MGGAYRLAADGGLMRAGYQEGQRTSSQKDYAIIRYGWYGKGL